MPKYSVLLTVYNSEKYLDECFNSILCQTFNDFEVVAGFFSPSADCLSALPRRRFR